jgi:hypothetical protein
MGIRMENRTCRQPFTRSQQRQEKSKNVRFHSINPANERGWWGCYVANLPLATVPNILYPRLRNGPLIIRPALPYTAAQSHIFDPPLKLSIWPSSFRFPIFVILSLILEDEIQVHNKRSKRDLGD